jgi:hypothetical protein
VTANGEFKNLMDIMEEESKKSGKFFKMLPTDSKNITILSEPEKGTSTFDNNNNQQHGQGQGQAPKAPRTVFRFKVKEDGNPEELLWEVGNRTVMQQIVAITKQYNLQSFINVKLLVKTSGTDNKSRAWFIMLLSAPGVAGGVPTPPAPVNQSAPDQGQQWLNDQMKGVKQ